MFSTHSQLPLIFMCLQTTTVILNIPTWPTLVAESVKQGTERLFRVPLGCLSQGEMSNLQRSKLFSLAIMRISARQLLS